VHALLELRHFDFVELLVTPSTDPRLVSIFSKAGVSPATVKQSEGHWALIQANRLTNVGPVQQGIDYMAPIVPGSHVTWLDFIMSRNLNYDYFVVHPSDTFFDSEFFRDNVIVPAEALNRVRILTVNLGLIYVSPMRKMSEDEYYCYRRHLLFPTFHSVRSLAGRVYSNPEDEVPAQLASLGQRLNFICRAADKVSFLSLKAANNITEDRILYHFGYFIMLVTGIFDDLAWIINHLYRLKLDGTKVVLKQEKQEKQEKRFYKKLREHDEALCAYLTSCEVQTRIQIFYPLRNRLQHRRFITGGMMVKERLNSGDIIVAIDRETYNRLHHVFSDGSKPHEKVALHSNEVWVEPHWFMGRALKCVDEVVNGVFKRIPQNLFRGNLSNEKWEALRKQPISTSESVFIDLPKPVFLWTR
jgi:hypothetical protein